MKNETNEHENTQEQSEMNLSLAKRNKNKMEKTTQAQVLRYWKDGYFYFSIYPISQNAINGNAVYSQTLKGNEVKK